MKVFSDFFGGLKTTLYQTALDAAQARRSLRADNYVLAWEHILFALAFSLGTTPFVYYATNWKAQKYSQFIVGSLAWSLGSKLQDYLLLLGIVVFFISAYLLVFFLSGFIFKNNGEEAEKAFRALLALSTLPIWLWVGSLFLSQSLYIGGRILLMLTPLVGSLLIIFSLLTAANYFKFSYQEFIDCVGTLILVILGVGFSSVVCLFALGRINLSWQVKGIEVVIELSFLSALIALLLVTVLCFYRSNGLRRVLRRVRIAALLVQLPLPACFLILVPTPWETPEGRIYGYPVRLSLCLLIGILVGLSYFDLFKRARITQPAESNSLFIKSALSPLCLSGALAFIKLLPIPAASIGADDYHFGEYLLPWWLWREFGQVPFHDFTPARGLINYVPSFLGDVFFDGTAASMQPAVAMQSFLVLLLGLLILPRALGVMPSFIMLLLLPLGNGLVEIDLVVTVVLCVLCDFFLKEKPVSWLALWTVLGISIFLIAPAQGGLLLISLLPLLLISFLRAYKEKRESFIAFLALGFVVAIALAFLTPVDQMLWGAWSYLREQSEINSIAHGISWPQSHGAVGAGGSLPINYWLWEAIRSSWIVVAIVSSLLIWQSLLSPQFLQRKRLLAFAVPIFLLVVLFIPRAAGRIDPLGLSRIGGASAWALSLLLPLVLLTTYSYFKNPLILLLSAFAGSCLTPISGLAENVFHQPLAVAQLSEGQVDGAQIGMPNLGKATIEPKQLHRLQRLQNVLNRGLMPGETYLDLTNRNANYYYLGYPPPIEGAVYNLAHSEQQRRALKRLQAIEPPIVVAGADNIIHDGGTVAFRSHLIYRYVINHYQPVKIDGFIYMVKPDRLERLVTLLGASPEESKGSIASWKATDQVSLLDEAFRLENIGNIPISWGRSFNTLKSQMHIVQPLNRESQVQSEVGSASTLPLENFPSATFELEQFHLKGKDSGLLVFDFQCNTHSGQFPLEVSWVSSSFGAKASRFEFAAENGTLIVPLDTSPRWLLADEIHSIQIKSMNPSACSDFSLSNVSLYQRNDLPQ